MEPIPYWSAFGAAGRSGQDQKISEIISAISAHLEHTGIHTNHLLLCASLHCLFTYRH